MAKKRELTATREIAAPAEIRRLVENFAEHRATYHRPGYNETQLRQDFLDPFFIALGWDVFNREGIHENYRDVILEHALRVEKSVKAQIEHTDAEIDRLVYELYGLSEEEIALVEGATGQA